MFENVNFCRISLGNTVNDETKQLPIINTFINVNISNHKYNCYEIKIFKCSNVQKVFLTGLHKATVVQI